MSLLNRIRGLFSRAQRITAIPPPSTPFKRKMAFILLVGKDGYLILNLQIWGSFSPAEISDVVRAYLDGLPARLDAAIAAARNAPRQTTEDIDTPRQMAMNFAQLLDTFSTEEPSYVF